jgi:hypothetical protein
MGCVPFTVGKACVVGDGGLAMNCGSVGDGCGGLVTCGPITCPAKGEVCGGAGIPNVCGSPTMIPLPDGGTATVDAGPTCVPETVAKACTGPGGAALCGKQSDGCGGSVDCTTVCMLPETCGGGGTPSQCGKTSCTALTQAAACAAPGGGTYCGDVSDGCGGFLTCPTCSVSGETCGGAGVPSKCGAPTCHPLTACPGSANCGLWPDGCGGTITCGTLGGNCTPPDICGGGGVPSECGDTPVADAGPCEAGLKCNLDTCDGGVLATLKGRVYDPAGPPPGNGNPVYNVVVYVPNSTPSPIAHGNPACVSCSSLYTGDPIVSTTTDTDGNFVLTGVPVPPAPNNNVPVVIQIGKWRRQMIWPNVKPCATNTASGATAQLLKLPGIETTTPPTVAGATLDDLPEIAVSTGAADSMECLFQRIGFAPGEYVPGWNGGHGHIHIFQGTPITPSLASADNIRNPATTAPPAPRSPTNLWDTNADMNNYDIVVLSCEGVETANAVPQNLEDFAYAGGRVFASHFQYSWFSGPIETGQSYAPPADWNSLATWHENSNAIFVSTDEYLEYNYLNANIVQSLADGGTPMKDWLGNVGALGGNAPPGELSLVQPRFNAEITATANPNSVNWIAPDNGPYWYEDDQDGGGPVPLPSDATQYFSFNTPINGTGNPAVPYCGRVVFSDLHVGSAANDYVGMTTFDDGGDVPIVPDGCATGSLTPQEKVLEYMLLDLASCPSSDTNLPTAPPVCTKAVCPANWCGPYPDGCGTGMLTCGSCEAGANCVNGACVACTPATACPAGIVCGDYPDGCGGILNCGTCDGSVCVAGKCESGCVPTGCPASITCGVTSNGCGGLTAECGPACPGTTTCGGGGTPGVCGESDGSECHPLACPAAMKCGMTGDGCGNVINCGDCSPPDTCGGGGTPNVCGHPDCTPETCASVGATCGQVADGCGGLTVNCGTCTGSATCGGGGVANQCGVPPCTPSTCSSLALNCGEAGDGCGNILQCGTCVAPETCGGGGTANVCGVQKQK